MRNLLITLSLIAGFPWSSSRLWAVDFDPVKISSWPGFSVGIMDDVVVNQDVAYGIYGSKGFAIFDISNPENPRLVGGYETPGNARDITVKDDYGYVALSEEGLEIIDISNPRSPLHVSFFRGKDFNAYSTFVSNDVIFVAGGAKGMLILDIQDPKNPLLVGQLDTPGFAYDVAYASDIVFLADHNIGLQVIDVHDYSQPLLLASYNTESQDACELAERNGLVYLAAGSSGLQIIDVADPNKPEHLGTYAETCQPRSFELKGSHVFLGCGSDGLQIIDITNPAEPVLEGVWRNSGVIRGLDVIENTAYVADSSEGFLVINVTDTSKPDFRGALKQYGGANDIKLADGLAYISSGFDGLIILNVTNPDKPEFIGQCLTTGPAQRAVVEGHYAYVTINVNGGGFDVIDVTDPSIPTVQGTFEGHVQAPIRLNDMAYSANHLIGVNVEGGIESFNVSDPTNPIHASSDWFYGASGSIVIKNQIAYLASFYHGLMIYDVSDPSSPRLIQSYMTGAQPSHVDVLDVYAYVAEYSTNEFGYCLQVFDVRNPRAIVPRGRYCLRQYEITNLKLSGGTAFISDPWFGVTSINVVDPDRPFRNGLFRATNARALDVKENTLFLADGQTGLQLVQYDRLANPQSRSSINVSTPGSIAADRLASAFDLVYLANFTNGISVYRFHEQGGISNEMTMNITGNTYHLALNGDLLYAVNQPLGLLVFDIQRPLDPILVEAYPSIVPRQICLTLNLVCTLTGDSEIRIYASRDDDTIEELGHYSGTERINAFAATNGFIYAVDSDWKIHMLDIRDPSSPHLASSASTLGNPMGLYVHDNFVLVASAEFGLEIFDTNNGPSIKRIGQWKSDLFAARVGVLDHYAYLSSGWMGFQVIDVAAPSFPRRVGGNTASGGNQILFSMDGLVFDDWVNNRLTFAEPFQPPLHFEKSIKVESNSVNFVLHGSPGSQVMIQRSTNLMQWEDWKTVSLESYFTPLSENPPPQAGSSFFRALQP